MKLLSFLGTTDYQEVTYTHAGAEYRTRFFPVAAARFFQPDSLHLVVTRAAYDKHFVAIKEEVGDAIDVVPVNIPEGRSEDEIWDIFDALTGHLHDGDEVVLDITYGFRSLPMLAIIAAAYLRVAKQVTFRHLIYGAFEVQDAVGRRPVFDLSPFLTLMEWTSATDLFLKTGNAGDLVAQLHAAHSLPYRRSAEHGPDEALPQQLQRVASSIGAVSTAMRLVRPHETMTATVGLDEKLAAVRPEAQQWAKPFGVLLDRTQAAYRPFALPEPLADVEQNLHNQLALIHWYLDRDQVVQAVTLAREWVVSLACVRRNLPLIDGRQEAEELLGKGLNALRAGRPLPAALLATPTLEPVVRAWSQIQDLRNDVAHCGMRAAPRPTNKIIAGIKLLAQSLDSLAETLSEDGTPTQT